MLKIIFRKYVLNPVYVVSAYLVFLCTLLFYINPFNNIINPGFIILFPLFLGIRFTDDFYDFYLDKLNGKAVLNRKILAVLAAVCFSIVFILSICFKRYLFIVLTLCSIIIYACRIDWVKLLVAPSAFLQIIFYEFSFDFSNMIIVVVSIAADILLMKLKKKDCFALEEIGGKAYNLQQLKIKNTPAFFPVKSEYLNPPDSEKLELIVKAFCKKNKLYAVRSSAIDEDSENASFAGVHETYLNVKKDEVLKRILDVAESARSEAALKYRKDNGLETENIKIGVLIQEMICADFAGVLNTINPVTNNISETVISVTKGLGDKLVDGSVDGTTYFIDSKKTEITGSDILNKKVINKLLKLADELRRKTNRFQDCEFAVKKNKVYFLQSRAITTYDVDSHNMNLLIDNSNLIESYYGITSPLTQSFAKEIYTKVYTETCRLGKVNNKTLKAIEPSLKNMLFSYEGKLYYNLNSWYNVTSIFPSKNSTKYMESMMGVKTGSKDYKKVKLGFFELIKVAFTLLTKFLQIDKLSEQFIKNFNRIVSPYYAKNLDYLSVEQLCSLYEKIDSEIIKEFTIPIINDLGVMMTFGRLKEKVKKYKNSDELLSNAVNNGGNVESAENATEFIALVDYIKCHKELSEDFETLSEEQLFNRYYEAEGDFSVKLKDYIYRFGPRVMNELKLETVTLIEEPKLIFGLLKDGLKNTNISRAENHTSDIPFALRRLSEKTRHYIKNRERLRLRRTYIFSVIRNIFLSCGKNLYKQGRIEDFRDVFYLTKNEIFYSNADVDFKQLVQVRKNQESIDSEKPYYSRIAFFGNTALPVLYNNPKGLCGIPSGHGVIKGKVCVMEDKNSFFEPDSIIVTKRTDPGWISLFPLAGGLIVEHGSMLSHSFVVAREMHLPCIVGVEGITGLLKTGDVVTLDALKGEIKIEAE